jgi:hypothetical protein
MPQSLAKLDAADAIFFGRELESVMARVWEARRPPLSAFEYFPITSEADPADVAIIWYEMDSIGEAKIIAAGSHDLPRIDVFMRENVGTIRQIGDKFAYTTQDIRAAQKSGKPLSTMQASAAMRATNLRMNTIAWFGDQAAQLPGFMTAANVSRVVPAAAAAAPNGTGWNSASGKTPDEIITDANNLINASISVSNGVETIDTVLMAPDEYAYIATVPRSGTSDTTILEFLRRVHPGVTFAAVAELADVLATRLPVQAGAAANMAVAFRRSDEVLRFEIPLQFTQLAPQPRDLEFEVPCEAKCGGLLVHLPLAIATMQGI